MENISSEQKIIWLAQNVQENSSMCNIGGYAHIKGALDVRLLTCLIREVLEHSDVLGITFKAFNEHKKFDLKAVCDIDVIELVHQADSNKACYDWMLHDMSIPLNINHCILVSKIIRVGEKRIFLVSKGASFGF